MRKILNSIPFAALLLATPVLAKDDALQMVSIDVEGGGGTLFVTPDGKSLLIDTGNPEVSKATGNTPSSARIAAAAHALGLKKIDYLLTTHYHGDHIGGLEGLLARIPIGTFVDHGENRETTASTQPGAPQIDLKNPPPGSSAAGYNKYIRADRQQAASRGQGRRCAQDRRHDRDHRDGRRQADRQAAAGRGRRECLLRRHGKHGQQRPARKMPAPPVR